MPQHQGAQLRRRHCLPVPSYPDCTGLNVLLPHLAGFAVSPALVPCRFPDLRSAVLCAVRQPANGLCVPPAQAVATR